MLSLQVRFLPGGCAAGFAEVEVFSGPGAIFSRRCRCFYIDMLAGMNRVSRSARVYSMLDFFLRVVISANEFESVDDLDWVQHLPDVIPELGEVSQEGGDKIRVTTVGDMCKLAAARTSGVAQPWRDHKNRVIAAHSNNSLLLLQSLPD